MSKTRTASVYIRDSNPPYAFRRVKDGRGQRKNDLTVVVSKDGQGQRVGELTGPFYTRPFVNGKQRWVALVGAETFEQAKAMATKNVAILDATQKGLKVDGLEEVTGSERLAAKIASYLAEVKANKAKKTFQAYANSLRLFQESCHKVNVGAVTREDMLAFKSAMRGEEFTERSTYNNFLNTMVFLKWAGVKTSIKKNDWPEKVEREPEEYTAEELAALFNAAEADERLLLKAFHASGLRTGEMAHLTYGDIDFPHSIWKVRAKDGWKTKTKAGQREVPVAPGVTAKIKARMQAGKHKLTDLIFPNTKGQPDAHLIRIVQRVAERAGITSRVDDHKFRATTITTWLRAGVAVQDVMKWVGHVSLSVVLRYAAKLKLRDEATRARAAAPFESFSNMGD